MYFAANKRNPDPLDLKNEEVSQNSEPRVEQFQGFSSLVILLRIQVVYIFLLWHPQKVDSMSAASQGCKKVSQVQTSSLHTASLKAAYHSAVILFQEQGDPFLGSPEDFLLCLLGQSHITRLWNHHYWLRIKKISS